MFAYDGSVGEDIDVEGTKDKVQICGNQVTDDVEVSGSSRDILVGDTLAGCGGNTVGDDIEVSHNYVDVELVVRGNTVTDDLKAFFNKGAAGKFVDTNTGGDTLSCFGNEQPFTGGPNTGFASAEGQCTSA